MVLSKKKTSGRDCLDGHEKEGLKTKRGREKEDSWTAPYSVQLSTAAQRPEMRQKINPRTKDQTEL